MHRSFFLCNERQTTTLHNCQPIKLIRSSYQFLITFHSDNVTSIEEFIPAGTEATTNPLGHPLIVFEQFEMALASFITRYKDKVDFEQGSMQPIVPLLTSGNDETIEDTLKRVQVAIEVSDTIIT